MIAIDPEFGLQNVDWSVPLDNDSPFANPIAFWVPGSPGLRSNRVFDLSGRKNNLTASGNAVFDVESPRNGNGPWSWAYVTNGVHRTASGLFSTTDASQPYSAFCWFKSTGAGGIITQFAGGANRFGMRSQGGVLKYWKAGDIAVSAQFINDGEWHFVGFVKAADQSVTLYIDGLPDGTGTDANAFESAPVSIGAFNTTAFLNGNIGDVLIYDRAFSQSEASALYVESLTGFPTLLERIPIPSYPSPPIVGGQWVAGDSYIPGFRQGQSYLPGFKEGDSYTPGFQEGEFYSPGFKEGQSS